MNSRFNYIAPPKRDSSEDDVFYKWSYEKKIRVLSSQKDGSVDDYVEENFWKKEKCSWSDFIESYDLGSVSEQVINHITKGTPLVTEHTLPAGDYTQLEKGAKLKRDIEVKGITMDDIIAAVKASMSNESGVVAEEKKEKVEVSE